MKNLTQEYYNLAIHAASEVDFDEGLITEESSVQDIADLCYDYAIFELRLEHGMYLEYEHNEELEAELFNVIKKAYQIEG